MSARSLAAVLLLVGTALAGCVTPAPGSGVETASSPDAATDLSPDDVPAPTGATVEEVEAGVAIRFEDVELPLEREIPVPEGTAVVDLEADLAEEDRTVFPELRHAETNAERCVTPYADGWTGTTTDASSCAGVALVDDLPTTWVASVSAGGSSDDPVVAETVTVTLHEGPLGGVAGQVDATNVSKRHHDVGETTTHAVESHDGKDLHVTVHEPDGGHDAYPTLLISTPYNTLSRAFGGTPYGALVEDWVQRGYAVVVADVRGFGQSDGCVEVWGPNEQGDQAALVDWITDQDWSDGHVGMMGASYPGTTPVEAAVEAPEGLDAIVPVASVVNAYQDWHYGGVPTGENLGSPAAYHAIGTATTPRPTDPVDTARDVGNGLCNAEMTAEANDPRAIYDGFYQERNFKERVGDVEAAVLQQHGFVDGTVKPSMLPGWFNELDVPKLGLFGHWAHNYAVRADTVFLQLAWMDQHVKGQDVGLDDTQTVSVETNGQHRTGDSWPPEDAETTRLHADLSEGTLASEPTESSTGMILDPTGLSQSFVSESSESRPESRVTLETTLDEAVPVAGAADVRLNVTLNGTSNAYVRGELWDVSDDRLVAYGAVNLAHRGSHSSYDPFAPGERATLDLPLLPTQYNLEAGDDVELVLEASEATGLTRGSNPGELVLHGGEEGTALELPTVPASDYGEVPPSVDPSPGT
jgi:putative CocE/NonD family hydrolase